MDSPAIALENMYKTTTNITKVPKKRKICTMQGWEEVKAKRWIIPRPFGPLLTSQHEFFHQSNANNHVYVQAIHAISNLGTHTKMFPLAKGSKAFSYEKFVGGKRGHLPTSLIV